MTSPRRPADPYGRPQPHLVTPPEPSARLHSPRNSTIREYLLRLLEDEYAPLFQPGIFADLYLHLHLREGTLDSDINVTVVRRHRFEEER